MAGVVPTPLGLHPNAIAIEAKTEIRDQAVAECVIRTQGQALIAIRGTTREINAVQSGSACLGPVSSRR